jgi:hypothetical protein
VNPIPFVILNKAIANRDSIDYLSVDLDPVPTKPTPGRAGHRNTIEDDSISINLHSSPDLGHLLRVRLSGDRDPRGEHPHVGLVLPW